MTGPVRRELAAALVGGGFIGSVHARALRLRNIELVGVAASTPASAREAAQRLGAREAFEDPLALVTHPDVDVVHICTPNQMHVPLGVAALEAGKHVVCEKPIATDLEGACELLAAARRAGALLAVPFVYRYYPMVRQARARMESGEFGRLHLIRGVYLQDWLLSESAQNWRLDVAAGGPSRAFADIGQHWCDLVEFVSGQRIAALSALLQAVVPRRSQRAAGADGHTCAGDHATEDLGVVSFRTTAGTLGSLVVSQVAPGHKNRLQFELAAHGGAVGFDQQRPDELTLAWPDRVELLERDPERMVADGARLSSLPAGHPFGFSDCVDAFVGDVYSVLTSAGDDIASLGGRAASLGLPTVTDGVRAAQITDAVLRSARADGEWVELAGVQRQAAR